MFIFKQFLKYIIISSTLKTEFYFSLRVEVLLIYRLIYNNELYIFQTPNFKLLITQLSQISKYLIYSNKLIYIH